MKIEHFAFNVADPVAVAAWYEAHCGLRVIRHLPLAAQTHFLADDGGSTVLEIYCNPPEQVPDYGAMDPLQFHMAFASESPPTDCDRLIAAGATLVDDIDLPDGTRLMMLRDPWGLAIQLCKRAIPLATSQHHSSVESPS